MSIVISFPSSSFRGLVTLSGVRDDVATPEVVAALEEVTALAIWDVDGGGGVGELGSLVAGEVGEEELLEAYVRE